MKGTSAGGSSLASPLPRIAANNSGRLAALPCGYPPNRAGAPHQWAPRTLDPDIGAQFLEEERRATAHARGLASDVAAARVEPGQGALYDDDEFFCNECSRLTSTTTTTLTDTTTTTTMSFLCNEVSRPTATTTLTATTTTTTNVVDGHCLCNEVSRPTVTTTPTATVMITTATSFV